MANNQFRYQTYRPNRPSTQPKKPTRTSHRRAVFITAFGIIIGIYGIYSATKAISHYVSLADSVATIKTVPIPSSLTKKINAIIAGSPTSQVGVALENTTSGETKTYGVTAPFEAASTAKLITAVAYYHLVEHGEASLTTPMGPYDAAFQMKEMINDSDNDAWNLLANAVGDDELAAYAASIGVNYGVAGNTLAPSDMTTLLTKLYNNQLLNKTDTDQLLSYMQNTNDETLIPAAVPSNITVYHKYGLLNGGLHDVAILVDGNTSYALAIYTKNADDSDDATRTTMIHQITQAVTSAVFNS